jgi:hypothetical protein
VARLAYRQESVLADRSRLSFPLALNLLGFILALCEAAVRQELFDSYYNQFQALVVEFRKASALFEEAATPEKRQELLRKLLEISRSGRRVLAHTRTL